TAKRNFQEWEERTDAQDMNLGFNAGSAGLKHQYIANDRLYFNNIISASISHNSNKTDTLTQDYVASLYHKDKFTNTAIRYAGSLNYRANSKSTIRAAINASLLRYDLYALTYDTELAALKERINEKGNTSTYDAFAQLKTELSDRLTLNTGLHANYF